MAIPKEYKAWFKKICGVAGLQGEYLEAAVRDGVLALGGVPFICVQGIVGSETHVLLQAVAAVLPKNRQLPILRRIMEVQMMLAGPNSFYFALEPKANCVLIILPVSPAECTPEQAVVKMGMMVHVIREWEETIFVPPSAAVTANQKHLFGNLERKATHA